MHTIETFQADDDKAAVRHILACARHDANRWETERRQKEREAVLQRLADSYARQQEAEWEARALLASLATLAVVVVALVVW